MPILCIITSDNGVALTSRDCEGQAIEDGLARQIPEVDIVETDVSILWVEAERLRIRCGADLWRDVHQLEHDLFLEDDYW